MTLFSPHYNQIPERSAQGIRAMPPRVGHSWAMTGGNWAETQGTFPGPSRAPFLFTLRLSVPPPRRLLSVPCPPGPTLRYPQHSLSSGLTGSSTGPCQEPATQQN